MNTSASTSAPLFHRYLHRHGIATALFSLGLAACSGGGGGGGGGGADMVIVPADEWDFVVTNLSTNPDPVGTGLDFTLSATVSNAPASSSNTPSSTLTYYRYTDSTLATVAETFTDTVAIPAIAPGTVPATNTSISLTAPSTAGSYYYGACMPTTGNDTDASNNCATATVTAVAPAWDFVVTNLATNLDPIGTGLDFTLSATVSNAAAANTNTPASTLTYYRYTDATLATVAETFTDTVSIPA
ncbi:MAG: hypothetical protein ACR2PW_01865, partial [Gammaproteobacteria bacterium]